MNYKMSETFEFSSFLYSFLYICYISHFKKKGGKNIYNKLKQICASILQNQLLG